MSRNEESDQGEAGLAWQEVCPEPRRAIENGKSKKGSAEKKPVAAASGLAFREFKALWRQLDLSLEELTTRLGLSPTTAGRTQGGGPPHDR